MKECIKVKKEGQGKEVLDYFINKGGENKHAFNGDCSAGVYYYIDKNNIICCSYRKLKDYTEIELPTTPKKMLFWNYAERVVERYLFKDLGERVVDCRYLTVDKDFEQEFLNGGKFEFEFFNYAKEIPQEEEMNKNLSIDGSINLNGKYVNLTMTFDGEETKTYYINGKLYPTTKS